MAKKPTAAVAPPATPPEPEKKERKSPSKLCSELNGTDCSGVIWGRTTECPVCGVPVIREAKAQKTRSQPAPDDRALRENAAMKFALRNGGFEKARKLIAALKENDSMDFAISAGGVEAAAALLEDVETSVHLG